VISLCQNSATPDTDIAVQSNHAQDADKQKKCSRTRLTIFLLKRLTSAAAAELNTVLRYMPRDA